MPEPAADVALDRLAVDPLAAEARDEHLHRHLALAEAGDLDGLGEIGGGVVDRVLDVVPRDVDRQADAVALELLDQVFTAPLNQNAPGLPISPIG